MSYSVVVTDIPTAELAEKVRERCLTEARHIDPSLSRVRARIDPEASGCPVVSESMDGGRVMVPQSNGAK